MDAGEFSVGVLGTEVSCEYINNSNRALASILELMNLPDVMLGVDIETTPLPSYASYPEAGLSPHLSSIRLLQIFDGTKCYIFDLRFIPFEIFIDLLETKRFVAHNAIFEISNFLHNGVRIINCACSMLLAKFIMHATYPTDSGLAASLAAIVKMCFDEELPKGLQRSDFSPDNLSFEQVQYAALDAIYCRYCAEKMAPGLVKLDMTSIFSITKKAQLPIASLQLNGITLNTEYYRTLIEQWRQDLYTDRREVLALTGLEEITPAKLGTWLGKSLPADVLRIWPRTDTDKLSTSADTFSDFSFLEIVEPLSRYQKKEKLLSTYGDSLLAQINPATGRLHAQYKLLGARTGRLSSSKPNLQNLPRDSDIRAAFIPRPGHVFIRADYNQIEIRVAAELSRDKTMLDAYRRGIDLHALTASKVSNKPLEAVTKSDRQKAKALNFGLLFGLGAKKFSHYAWKSYGAKVTDDEAHEAVNVFRETYYGYREWQLTQADNGATRMISKTPGGKVRKLSTENCYGASMNTPVQGGAAEVMLRALTRLYMDIDDTTMQIVNCVHDENLLEVLDEPAVITEACEILRDSMTRGFLDIFPNGVTNNLVSPVAGSNWAEAK